MNHSSPSADELEEVFDGVYLTELTHGEQTNINYLKLEPSAEVPIHSHHNEQHGFVHEGTLTLTTEDGNDVTVAAGEGYSLEGDESHGAANRGDEPVVAIDIFSPPRDVSSSD